MKLKNKKTGEIGEIGYIGSSSGELSVSPINRVACESVASYNSLTELNEEWEDYDEGKEWYWYIEDNGIIQRSCHYEDLHPTLDKARKDIGNYFDTREEAEKAVEKLQALANLRKNGFKFTGWDCDETTTSIRFNLIIKAETDGAATDDLDVLFGGK